MPHDFCSRCPGCSGDWPVVPSSGPAHCDLLFIGERPGQEENYRRIPFCGKSGRDMNEHYLPLAGLRRPNIRFTNCVRCWAPGNRKPTVREFDECTRYHLQREIEHTNPSMLVLMGGVALQLAPELDLETHHGFPHLVEVFGVRRWVFSTYHPALGLHDKTKIRHLRDDFEALWRVLQVSDPASCQPVDKWAGKERYSKSREPFLNAPKLYLDTETIDGDDEVDGNKAVMWSGQLSVRPGEGRLYKADDPEAMRAFQQSVASCGELSIHNRVFDEEVMWRAGIEFDPARVSDTMYKAWHLGLAQGLKPLAYRLAGMRMRTFQELVFPPSRGLVLAWLMRAFELTEPEIVERIGKRGQRLKDGEIAHPLRAEVKRMVNSVTTNDRYNPWKRWKEVKGGDTAGGGEKGELAALFALAVESELGVLPRAGIDKVEESEAVWYGCRDSDADCRVDPVLQHMSERIGKEVERRDYDQCSDE